MQVTLKTLQQQTFKIDIDPDETVRAAGTRGRGGRARAAGPGRRGGATVRGVPASALSRARRRPEQGEPGCTWESVACGSGSWLLMRPAGYGRGQGRVSLTQWRAAVWTFRSWPRALWQE